MSNSPSHSSRFPRFRQLWRPALATGTGGAAVAIWFEEVIALATEFIGVIILTVLGALICLFDYFVLKSRTPRQEDLHNKGEKN